MYRWQLTQINANTAVQQRDKQIADLSRQLDVLTAEHASDTTTLASQSAALKTATSKLTDIEAQLKKGEADLAAQTKQLSDAQAQVKSQQDQLTTNATELAKLRARPPLFSFQNQSNIANVDQKEADIRALVTSAYDYMQEIYGQPYLLNQITITFVDNFTIAGAAGEITIANGPSGINIDIHLKDFDNTSFQDKNTMIHEMAHGFQGIASNNDSALAEGETVAVTDAVMQRMIDDGKMQKFPNLYLIETPQQYTDWNKNIDIPANTNDFYSSPDIAKIYQVIGQAWMNLYNSDPTFFKRFNEAYYKHIQNGEAPSHDLAISVIKQVISTVNGTPIADYLAANSAFNSR